jgi:cellulose synthase/poly-beta-1,6-N-acetylglucosamine synthase-like glycosyltransferase
MSARAIVDGLEGFFVLYLVGYVGFNVFFFAAAAVRIAAHRLRLMAVTPEVETQLPPVSFVIPAFNEAPTIVQTVRSCLRSDYPFFDVIVVNDGSDDATLATLMEAYELCPTTRVPRVRVPFRRVRGVYVSRLEPRLLVVDKDNGGRADALNAGLAFSRAHLIACIDADSIVEPDSLLRCARAFADPRTVSAGGVVRVLNGCTVRDGKVIETSLPRNPLAVMQAIEYTRAFFVQRTAMEAFNALAIISGAFGLFRREDVVAAGGFSGATAAEDMEMVLRLHRHLRQRQGAAYRQVFVPDPVVWTEVPEKVRDLGGQRRRWQRGLATALWMYRGMVLNPTYGWFGMVVLPYYWLYELGEPLVLSIGYGTAALAAAVRWLSPEAFVGLVALPLSLNLVLSLLALVYGEVPFGRYRGLRDVLRLVFWTVTELLWYRWLLVIWRLVGLWQAARRSRPQWERPTRLGHWAAEGAAGGETVHHGGSD